MKRIIATLLFPLLFLACTKGPGKDLSDDGTFMAKITLAGDYVDVSTSQLITRSSDKNTYYAFEIDSVTVVTDVITGHIVTDTVYVRCAEGVFTDMKNLSVALDKNRNYRVRCNIFEAREDDIYRDSDGNVFEPFLSEYSSGSKIKLNIWSYKPKYELLDLSDTRELKVRKDEKTRSTCAKMDFYYGETVTSKNIVLDMQRKSFGLHYLLAPPKEGELSIMSIGVSYVLTPESSSIDEEYIFTPILGGNKIGANMGIKVLWTSAEGETKDFSPSSAILIEPKTMTTIIVDINGRIGESDIVITKDSELIKNSDVVIN